MNHPPALVIAGAQTGSGKSTLTAGLLRAFRRRGWNPAPFKVGPDYLDPMLHRAAAGRDSWNLDPWMMPEAALRETLHRGSAGAAVAVVEGVMGLLDGADPVTWEGSTADLARRLDLPVVLVVDGSKLGGSVAALLKGFEVLGRDLTFQGVVFNGVREGHARLLRAATEAHTSLRVLGQVPPLDAWKLPERHLGIWQPWELPDLEPALEALADTLEAHLDLEAWIHPSAPILSAEPSHPGDLPVGLAWDEAFGFAYADTLERLERLGVRWVRFSPLRDCLPEGLAGLYLPGGYPELHAEALSRNGAFLEPLRHQLSQGFPCYAECGGLMVLAEALVDGQGRSHPMVGALPGRAIMTAQLQHFGYKTLHATTESLFALPGETARGHEFHTSRWEGGLEPNAYQALPVQGPGHPEGFCRGNLLASYAHLHFASNPVWAERWVARMRRQPRA